MKRNLSRQKINFMISHENMLQLRQLIPSGDRSNFINKTLEEALIIFKRQKASEAIDKLREEWKLKISTKELIKLKNHGRK